MLDYGEAYLELNQDAIKRLTEMMSPSLADVALEMAPSQQDEIVDDEQELEAA